MEWNKPYISTKASIVPWIMLQNVVIVTLLAVASAMGSIILDRSIQGGLAIEGSQIQWVNVNYLLGINTIVPAANYFADKHGYKKLFFLGVMIFLLGTASAGFATNFYILAIARLVEGMGAGVIFPVGLSIIAHYFPKEKVGSAINLYLGLGFGLGAALGSLAAGYIGMYYPWQFFFLFMIPNCLLSMLIILLFQGESEKIPRDKFDLFGFFTFVIAISSLLVALANGQLKSTAEGWRSPFIIGCLVVFAISLITFLYHEYKSKSPFIYIGLFKNSLFSIGCLTLFVLGMSVFATPSLMTKYLEVGLRYDKFTIGCNLIAYGLSLGFFSMVANALTKMIPAALLSILGLITIIISYFLNNILTLQSGKEIIATIAILRGMGLGLALGPITIQSLKQVPKAFLSQASTLLTFFRQVGGTFGGIILGIIILRRDIFHTARFAEPVHRQLVGYQYTAQKLQEEITQRAGSAPMQAQEQAKAIIEGDIMIQSYIQSINDALFVFGYVTAVFALFLIVANLIHWIREKRQPLTTK